MLLNLDILQDNLSPFYTMQRYGSAQRTLCCRRPLLYEPGGTLLEDTLYIVGNEPFPQELPPQNCSFISIGTRPPQEWIFKGIPILQIKGNFRSIEIFNKIQCVYDAFEQWDEALHEELEKEEDFDIQNTIRLGVNAFKYDISISDCTLTALFYGFLSQKEDGSRETVVQNKLQCLSPEVSEMIKEVCHMERVIKVPYLSAVNLKGHFYCSNVYISEHFAGCLSIGNYNSEFSFRDIDFPLMDYYLNFLQKSYIKYLRTASQNERPGLSALRHLLSFGNISGEDLRQLSLNPGEIWTVFQLSPHKGERTFPKEYLCSSLNTIFSNNIFTIIHHDNLLGLLRLTDMKIQENQIWTDFEHFITRMGYTAGVSMPFTNLRQFHSYCLQADYAATRVQKSNHESTLLFQDCVLQYMLNECLSSMDVQAILSPGMKRLMEHDHQKGTEHLKTLETYLRNEMSIVHSAQELFIHRSSLIKRLEKIQKLLGDDLSDPEHRLYFRLCLMLLRL